jgi:hypothetical protein
MASGRLYVKMHFHLTAGVAGQKPITSQAVPAHEVV